MTVPVTEAVRAFGSAAGHTAGRLAPDAVSAGTEYVQEQTTEYATDAAAGALNTFVGPLVRLVEAVGVPILVSVVSVVFVILGIVILLSKQIADVVPAGRIAKAARSLA